MGAGLGEIDSHVPITIREDRRASPSPQQLDNPSEQQVDVYSRYGTGFVDLGLGLEGRLAGPVTLRGRVLGDYAFRAPGGALGLDVGLGVDL